MQGAIRVTVKATDTRSSQLLRQPDTALLMITVMADVSTGANFATTDIAVAMALENKCICNVENPFRIASK